MCLAPDASATFVSVEQAWREQRLDVVFRDVCSLQMYERRDDAHSAVKLSVPFSHAGGSYQIFCAGIAECPNLLCEKEPDCSRAAGKCLGVQPIHRPKSTSHLSRLPPDDVAAIMHRRLHLGTAKLRNLAKVSADAPQRLAEAQPLSCPHCVEANAVHLPHSGKSYSPSYPGRLIHADIVGPFRSSAAGRFRYALILVDDHSRFKFVYFLKTKDEALARTNSFVASFNAYANKHREHPIRAVGSLRTDNAGEFLSREFGDMLDDHSIDQTTCPPYVHSLNGVAERAIKSIVEVARSNMVASGAPIGFWPDAI